MNLEKLKKSSWLFLSAVLVAGLFVSARADDSDDKVTGVSFGPRASYFMPKDSDDDTWSGGAQLRVRPWQGLGFEGSIDYRREKFGDTRVHVYPVQASVLAYILPTKPFNIFLLGGGGWYYTTVDRPSPNDDTTDHRFGLHAGGGMEYFLSDDWSLDATYRYVWLEDVKSKDANLFDKEFNDSGSQLTAGLNYHF